MGKEIEHLLSFQRPALELFRRQSEHNITFKTFLSGLSESRRHPKSIHEIPLLPISAFKYHDVQTGVWSPQRIFRSSGTTGQTTSRHLVKEESFYVSNSIKGFTQFFGNPESYCHLALLPGYLERNDASLVFMIRALIECSKYEQSGFYLSDHAELNRVLEGNKAKNTPTVLWGVSYAILDFIDNGYSLVFPDLKVIETGGMKGRREEWTKEKLHDTIQKGFGVSAAYSEYGMTELFSQAYMMNEFEFQTTDSLRIIIKDIYDPFESLSPGKTGQVGVIDLANKETCSFILTDDIGRMTQTGNFEILGRKDAAELRGCNLMLFG